MNKYVMYVEPVVSPLCERNTHRWKPCRELHHDVLRMPKTEDNTKPNILSSGVHCVTTFLTTTFVYQDSMSWKI